MSDRDTVVTIRLRGPQAERYKALELLQASINHDEVLMQYLLQVEVWTDVGERDRE